MTNVHIYDNVGGIELESNDGIDIASIRPFVIVNTITIADNISSEFIDDEYVKEYSIYDRINEYLNEIHEVIFDDICTILNANDIDIE